MTDLTTPNQADYLRTIENLKIHQAELSAQNQELRRIQQELKASEQEYAQIYNESPIGYATLDSVSGIVRSNDRLKQMLGLDLNEIDGRHHLINFIHPDDQNYFRLRYDAFFKLPKHKSYTVRINNSSGTDLYVRVLAKKLPRDEGIDGEAFIHATFTDITELKHAENEMRYQAYHDALSGLYNRKYFEAALSDAYQQAEKDNRQAGLLYLDLDHFKKINDTHGHKIGDLFLCEVARRLTQLIDDEGVVARLGGDEFVVLVKPQPENTHHHLNRLTRLSNQVLHALSARYVIDGVVLESSASIGVINFPIKNTPLSQVINHADTAMYEAKASGRNRAMFFEDVMQRRITRKIQLETELKQSLDTDNFVLFYQPKYNYHGEIVGAEALIRWYHPIRGLLTPDQFIEIAESTGLIIDLGQIVIEQSFKLIRRLGDQGLLNDDFVLSVNVSSTQFKAGNLLDTLTSALTHSQIEASHIRIEITEGVLLDIEDSLLRLMLNLKAMGFTFSIDDFGTGYSSMAYLHTLPVSELKIDRSFVTEIGKNDRDNAIVETLLLLSERLNLESVAEGVETQQQLDYLNDHKCHYYQGFMFAKPMPESDFVGMLHRQIKF